MRIKLDVIEFHLLRPIVRGLAKLKIPPIIGSALLLLSIVGLIGYGAFFLAAPVVFWAAPPLFSGARTAIERGLKLGQTCAGWRGSPWH